MSNKITIKRRKKRDRSTEKQRVEIDDKLRERVVLCVVNGYTVEKIAALMGIAVKSLKKYCAHELNNGREIFVDMATGALAKQIKMGSERSTQFALKSKGGWIDKNDDHNDPITININSNGDGKIK